MGSPLWAALGVDAVAQGRYLEPGGAASAAAPAAKLPVARGPFQPTAESLKSYQVPAWFRDAKFGIWAHWGPQAVGRSGDWYARWMYVPGHKHYSHHLEHFGHPSVSGYKDIIPLWKAEKFDPEALMDRYVAAGAACVSAYPSISEPATTGSIRATNTISSGRRSASITTAPEVIHMLADIASKNGNLLLNVALYPDGSLPPESQTLLAKLAAWMKLNAEAIHDTRPWTSFGEGPTETAAGAFKEGTAYTAEDIRFTTREGTLYAITLGEPRGRVAIRSLGRSAGEQQRAVRSVHLLGVPGPLKFQQSDATLLIELPGRLPARHASAFKLTFGG